MLLNSYIQGCVVHTVYCTCLYLQFYCVPSLFGILAILNWEMRWLNLFISVILAKWLKWWDNGLVNSALILLRAIIWYVFLLAHQRCAASHKIHMHKYRVMHEIVRVPGWDEWIWTMSHQKWSKSRNGLSANPVDCEWVCVLNGTRTRIAEFVRLVKAMQRASTGKQARS